MGTLAALLLTILGLAAPGELPKFASAGYGLKLEAPAGWTIRSQPSATGGGILVSLRSAQAPARLLFDVRANVMKKAYSAEQARQYDLEFLKGKAQYGAPKLFEAHLAGLPAKGIEVVYHAAGDADYTVRKLHVVREELHYSVEASGLVEGFADCEKDIRLVLDGIQIDTVGPEAREQRGFELLSARCGSEIDWAGDWAAAALAAREQHKPVLVSANFLQGFALADQAQTGCFMDPDVVALVRERFTALKLAPGVEVPFAAQTSYGLSASSFGVALMIVSGDGAVLEETECLEPRAVDVFLRESLERHPELSGESGSEPKKVLAKAERSFRRGELALVLQLLHEETSAQAHLLRARTYRRLLSGTAALDAIELAAKLQPSEALAREVELERAQILIGLGRVAEAATIYARILAADPKDAHAQYASGVCALYQARIEAARSAWQKLAREQPDDRWAWAAAAALDSHALEMAVRWDPHLVDPAQLRLLRRPDPAPLPPESAREAKSAALAYLVREQRADGSWGAPSEILDYETARTDPFVDAATALAGEALLTEPKQPAARAAAEKALRSVLASIEIAKGKPASIEYMDYTVWSRSLELRFLARCTETGLGTREELSEAAKWLVSDLRSKRRPGGGWSYYLTTDLFGEGAQDQQSISFVVAAVTLALQRAAETKLWTPNELLTGALDCLERMRGPDGAFTYMLGAEAKAPKISPTPAGSAGRGPACELALFHGQRSDPKRLARALELYRQHSASLLRERGKVLMHCGPEGQGCHYILFDLWTAALATRELPEKERAPNRALLLEAILDLRSKDGAFRDTPILGWNCGTAMALLAIDALVIGETEGSGTRSPR